MVKNKLYKHHKSKAALLMRNFAIGFSSIIAFVALAAIPTYISVSNVSEAQANKVEEKVESNEEETNIEEETLLSIN